MIGGIRGRDEWRGFHACNQVYTGQSNPTCYTPEEALTSSSASCCCSSSASLAPPSAPPLLPWAATPADDAPVPLDPAVLSCWPSFSLGDSRDSASAAARTACLAASAFCRARFLSDENRAKTVRVVGLR